MADEMKINMGSALIMNKIFYSLHRYNGRVATHAGKSACQADLFQKLLPINHYPWDNLAIRMPRIILKLNYNFIWTWI